MRLFLLSLSLILIGTWLIIVFNNYFQLAGLKINWLLLFMLVLTFRHSTLLLAFIGILAGSICDALSHGIIGLYGTSFFITLILVSQANSLFYVKSTLAVSLGVFIMTLFEGWLSLSILDMLEPGINQASLMLTSILPVAVMHGVITPITLQMITWAENLVLRETA